MQLEPRTQNLSKISLLPLWTKYFYSSPPLPTGPPFRVLHIFVDLNVHDTHALDIQGGDSLL